MAYFNINKPKESGIEKYEEEETDDRPVFLIPKKKHFVMLTKEEREAEIKKTETEAKAAKKPVGPVKIGKTIYEKGKKIYALPDRAVRGSISLFSSKKKLEEERLKAEVFKEEREKTIRAKYREEALTEITGKTKEYRLMDEKIKQQEKLVEDAKTKVKIKSHEVELAKKDPVLSKHYEDLKQERSRRLDEKLEKEKELEKFKSELKDKRQKEKDDLFEIKKKEQEELEKFKKEAEKKDEELKKKEELFKQREVKLNELEKVYEEREEEKEKIRKIKEVQYSGRDIELARRYIKDHPELKEIKGSKLELEHQIAITYHKGEDPADIDWSAYSSKDKSLKETLGDERQMKFFDEE